MKQGNQVPQRVNAPIKTSPARNMVTGGSKGSIMRGKEAPVGFSKKEMKPC